MSIDRREFVRAALAGAALLGPRRALAAMPRWSPLTGSLSPAPLVARPRPTRAQLAWQRDELAMFIHFGMNTFTDREWGDGTDDPQLFDPTALDARQWARTARAAGFKAMVLTAKHHDGFCLWPTRTTRYSVTSSRWRGGRGDLVREFVDACRAEGLKPGLYLSPWDRHEPSYGEGARYNAYYEGQLTELLTNYGPLHEVWFDGASAEGPSGRRQEYDWPHIWGVVRRLQPEAVMFSDAGPDLRWIGNERGAAGTTNWSTVRPEIVPVPGMVGEEVMRSLQDGDADGTVWRPGETDVSIRPAWFYRESQDLQVRPPDDLVRLYFTSVGRNSKLLLNVPPTRAGLLHATDVASLQGMRTQLDTILARDLALGLPMRWRSTGARSAVGEVELPADSTVSILDLREDIEFGQVVSRYVLEGSTGAEWRELARGTTIGYRRLERVAPVRVRRLRLTVLEALEPPSPVALGCFSAP